MKMKIEGPKLSHWLYWCHYLLVHRNLHNIKKIESNKEQIQENDGTSNVKFMSIDDTVQEGRCMDGEGTEK
jgi:hypothetical protein